MPSRIEWTGETWNPVRGCSPVSAGCDHCYAVRQAARFDYGPGAMMRDGKIVKTPTGPYFGLTKNKQGTPRWSGEARMVPSMLAKPLHWRKPRRVFVNSMSDLFHGGVSDEFIAAVFGVMAATPQHTYQVLTKRPERARDWFGWAARFGELRSDTLHRVRNNTNRLGGLDLVGPVHTKGVDWPLPNVWIGVSAEDQATANQRIPILLDTPAAVRFVSFEPLLEPVCVRTGLLDWVIVGGESGPGARTCDQQWIRQIVADCYCNQVPVFVKQLGGHPDKRNNPDLWPPVLRVRQWPKGKGTDEQE